MNPSTAINWSSLGGASLEVHLLGVVDFDACLALQDRYVSEIATRRDLHGALFVCEHPPIVTVGRQGSQADLLCEMEELTARQMEIRRLHRGGGMLVHAPGQVALYPILPVERLGLGLAAYRERLESAVIDACGEFHVEARRREEEAGVWCRSGQLAFVGATVRGGVSSHGVFVNVGPRMDLLRLVRSGSGRITSLSAERRSPTAMAPVRESLIRNLAALLNYDRYHLYTGHPLLKRTRRVVAYA